MSSGIALDLREAVIFLTAAGVVLPLMHKVRISPIIGFLGIGLLLGPSGLGRFSDSLPGIRYLLFTDREGIALLSELGLVFLLFMIGLELSLDRLWAMRVRVFGLGGAQVVVTGAVLAALLSLLGLPPPAAIVIGSALAMSSTAIVMQMLTERGATGSRLGRSALAILLFQDLAVVPILLMTQAFGTVGDHSVTLDLALAMVKAAIAIAVIWPTLPIFARAHDTQHARLLLGTGATAIALMPLEVSLQLSEAVLGVAGIPDEQAHAIIGSERERQQAALKPPAD